MGGRGERKRKAPFPGPWKLDGCYVCILKDLRYDVKKSDFLVLEKKNMWRQGAAEGLRLEREREKGKEKEERGRDMGK